MVRNRVMVETEIMVRSRVMVETEIMVRSMVLRKVIKGRKSVEEEKKHMDKWNYGVGQGNPS